MQSSFEKVPNNLFFCRVLEVNVLLSVSPTHAVCICPPLDKKHILLAYLSSERKIDKQGYRRILVTYRFRSWL